MKKRVYLLIVLLVTFWNCNEQNFEESVNLTLSSGFAPKENSGIEVGIKEIEAYLELQYAADSTLEVQSIKPYVMENDTVMYIVNYQEEKGWKVISGDKRTTALLACSAKGNLDINDLHPGISVWLERMGESIVALRKVPQIETTGENIELWQRIDSYMELKCIREEMSEELQTTRSNQYHWELMSISDIQTGSTLYGPYTRTCWGQNEPWNRCVPSCSPTLPVKCPAGCLAVAGAQMLYYLHYKIEVPQYAYRQGLCQGWASSVQDQSYTFQFSNPDATIWDLMPLKKIYPITQYADYVSTLIGNVGYSIKTIYTFEGSSALNSDLVKYFNNNNIVCTYENYNEDKVLSSLRNEMPVIVTAFGTPKPGSSANSGRHSWIIDGFEIKRYKTIYTYGLADENGNFLDEYMEPDQGQEEKDTAKDDEGFGKGDYMRDSSIDVQGVLPILMGGQVPEKLGKQLLIRLFLL